MGQSRSVQLPVPGYGLLELIDPFVSPGAYEHYFSLELPFETIHVDLDALLQALVGHVDRQYGRDLQVLDLGVEQKVPLKVLHIGNDHDHIRKILVSLVQKGAEHDVLVNAGGIDAVGSGQVDHARLQAGPYSGRPDLLVYGDPGIVPDFLLESGKLIEE